MIVQPNNDDQLVRAVFQKGPRRPNQVALTLPQPVREIMQQIVLGHQINIVNIESWGSSGQAGSGYPIMFYAHE